MCSRICDRPAPRCSCSSTLPVAHQTCTLATGALRSSCTMMVSPFVRICLRAVLGGKVMPAPVSGGVALRFALNIPPHQSASGVAIQLRELRSRRWPIDRNVRIRALLGLERFHKRFVEIEDVLEILNRIFLGLSEN